MIKRATLAGPPNRGEKNMKELSLIEAAGGDTNKVRGLLADGADVNARTLDGETALHRAARFSLENCQVLIDAGAEVNAAEDFGITPLFFAVDFRHPDIVRLLISHGADVNARLRNKATPLFYAEGNGDVAMVELLANAGADPNVHDARFLTPLILAALSGQYEIVRFLIAHGANVHAEVPKDMPFIPFASVGRQTAIAGALVHGHLDIADVLESAGARRSDFSLTSAVRDE